MKHAIIACFGLLIFAAGVFLSIEDQPAWINYTLAVIGLIIICTGVILAIRDRMRKIRREPGA